MKIADDRLGRKNYVKFLCHLIANCEKYKRESESKSFTMAIDSPWGTGKSTLLDFVDQELTLNEKFKVIRYNAWEYDFINDAFEPLMYTILNSDVFDKTKKEWNVVALTMEGWSCIKAAGSDVAAAFGVGNTYNAFYNLMNTSFKILNGDDIQLDKYCKDFLLQFGVIGAFREALNRCCVVDKETNQSTLVIVIDELDRCRPTFAIETLEIVKHLFNIPKVVFVFAVDVKQLGYSMTSAYGAQMDTAGYLLRFFDYVTRIPEPNLREYISNALGNSIIDKEIESPLIANETTSPKNAIVDYFLYLKQNLNLSLRDIDTLVKNYNILLDTVLKDENQVGPLLIYLFFITLKYKMPDVYGTLLSDTLSVEKDAILKKYGLDKSIVTQYGYVTSAIVKIKSNTIMALEEHLILIDGVIYSEDEKIINFQFVGNKIVYLKGPFNREIEINYGYSVDGVLYKRDLEKWEDIKTMTYSSYISQQLENFNFSSDLK